MVVRNPSDAGMTLQDDINKINNWAESRLVKFNSAKSESLVISRKTSKPVNPNLNMSSTSLYKNSFLPSVVGEWNLLPQNIRDLESVSSFKDYLNIDKPIPNELFLVAKRRFQIIHARLRNECSSLKHHLLIRKIVETPLCVCGAVETNQHCFFECPLYRNAKNILHRFFFSHFSCVVDLNALLFGSDA